MKVKLRPWHIFAAALALRLGLVFALPAPPVQNDALEYETIGANLAASGCYCLNPGEPTASRPPGYPLFLGGIYRVFGHHRQAARAAQAVLGAATCLLIFYTFLPLFGGRAALIGAALCALHPVLIVYADYLLTETLCTFLLCACMLFFSRWQSGGRLPSLTFSALCFALGTMTRPDLVLLPFFLFGCAALTTKRLLAPVKGLALFFALLAVLVLPWALRNQARLGTPILFVSGKGEQFIYLLVKGGPTLANVAEYDALTAGAKNDVERGEILNAEMRRMLREQAVRTVFRALGAVRFIPPFWITSHSSVFGINRPNSEYEKEGRWGLLAVKAALLLLQLAVLAAAAAGMYIARDQMGTALPFMLLLVYFTLHLGNVPRYHLPVLPYLLAFAGLAATRLLPGET